MPFQGQFSWLHLDLFCLTHLSLADDGSLSKGSKGDAVKAMQTMLIACGFSCGPDGADGDFGKNTLAGLTAFQTAQGLTANGVYDAKSKAALEKAYSAIPAPAVTACDASKVIAVAAAEIGYKEKKSNAQLDDKAAGKLYGAVRVQSAVPRVLRGKFQFKIVSNIEAVQLRFSISKKGERR